MLQKAKEETDGENKQTVVEDLNEIDLELDDGEDNFKGLDGGDDNEEEKPTRKSFGEKKDSEEDNQAANDDDDDDEVNVDEDETDESGSKAKEAPVNTPKISITVHKKEVVPMIEPTEESYDYSLLDELFGILDVEDANSIEPILCGYFNKIVQALLGKIKTKMLQYLLLKRDGDVFPKLLNCLQHHSLAQLMMELLALKVVPQPLSHRTGGASGGMLSNNNGGSRGFAFDNGGDDEDEENDENGTNGG